MANQGTVKFSRGTYVEKVSGYAWVGRVIATVYTLDYEERVVVQCTHPEMYGALHIFNPGQLRKATHVRCPACGGTKGHTRWIFHITCSTCGGEGKVRA